MWDLQECVFEVGACGGHLECQPGIQHVPWSPAREFRAKTARSKQQTSKPPVMFLTACRQLHVFTWPQVAFFLSDSQKRENPSKTSLTGSPRQVVFLETMRREVREERRRK